MKKDFLVFLVKVLIYALGLIASYLGVTSLTSCSSSRDVVVRGRAVIVTTDSTFVDHNRNFDYHVSYRK